MTWTDRVKKLAAGRWAERMNLLVYTLVVLAIVVVANWFVHRHGRRWDLTPNKRFSLSEQTQKILQGLDRDVTIYVFDRERAFQGRRDLLDNYAVGSRRVTVRYVDPDRQLTVAKQMGVRSFGTIVVAAGDHHFEAQGATEEGITNALIHLLKGQKTIYFLQGHGERDLEGSDRDAYEQIKKQLEDESYVVRTHVLLQKMEVPSDCSVLVIAGPQQDYELPEVDTIRNYVKTGGRLLVLLDAGVNVPTLAKLLAEWNVIVQNDLVIDLNPVAQLFGTSPSMPLIVRYGSSPIVKPLARTATLFPVSRSFELGKEGKAGATTESLCETSADSFGVMGFHPRMQVVSYRAGRDRKGPLTLAASVSLRSESEKKTEGRFVVVGTSLLAANRYLGFQGNRDLFMNTVNWLSADEDLISVRPRPPESQTLSLTTRQMRWILVGLIGVPLVVLAIGVAVWWQRR